MINKYEIVRDWIDRINDEGVNLTEWEIQYMESVTDQFDRRGSISDKQEEIVERIYVEKVS
jgi:hypothetical protein